MCKIEGKITEKNNIELNNVDNGEQQMEKKINESIFHFGTQIDIESIFWKYLWSHSFLIDVYSTFVDTDTTRKRKFISVCHWNARRKISCWKAVT